MKMSFWDTMLGTRLAYTLDRSLPSIADSLSKLTNPAKRTQHAESVYEHALVEYLNGEFEKGRVFVSATPLAGSHGTWFLVITE